LLVEEELVDIEDLGAVYLGRAVASKLRLSINNGVAALAVKVAAVAESKLLASCQRWVGDAARAVCSVLLAIQCLVNARAL
jgi:hypothetical protein